MAERYDVSVKVVSIKGTCAAGHKVGDEWFIKDDKTPAGICMGAFSAIFPDAHALTYGGSFPWSSDPDKCQVACADANNPVVFELRRVPK